VRRSTYTDADTQEVLQEDADTDSRSHSYPCPAHSHASATYEHTNSAEYGYSDAARIYSSAYVHASANTTGSAVQRTAICYDTGGYASSGIIVGCERTTADG
jgi:hypothetical protein